MSDHRCDGTCCDGAMRGLGHDTNCPGQVVSVSANVQPLWWLHNYRICEPAKERRERIATAILAGFAADRMFTELVAHNAMHSGPDAARMAVMWADALIAELDK